MTCITRKLAIIVGLLCCANQAFSMDNQEYNHKQQAKMKAYNQLGGEGQELAQHIPALLKNEKGAIKVPFLISTAMFIMGGIGMYGVYKYPSQLKDPQIAAGSILSCACGLWALIKNVPCAYKSYNNIRELNKPSNNIDWAKIRWMAIETLQKSTDLTGVNEDLIKNSKYDGNYELNNSNGTAVPTTVPWNLNDTATFEKIITHRYNSPQWTFKPSSSPLKKETEI